MLTKIRIVYKSGVAVQWIISSSFAKTLIIITATVRGTMSETNRTATFEGTNGIGTEGILGFVIVKHFLN